MSADEFQELWKAYDAKLEHQMQLNQRLITEIGMQKLHRSFNWQIVFKGMMILLGIGWNILIGSLLWRFRSEPVFVASAGIVLCCTGYSIGGYLVQLILMLRLRMSENIVETQKQLALLEAMIIRTLRVGLLQTPAYTFFFVTRQTMSTAGWGFWVIQVCTTGLAVAATVWAYRHVNAFNAGKKGWVKEMVDNEGGKSIARARQFIREVKDWEKEA